MTSRARMRKRNTVLSSLGAAAVAGLAATGIVLASQTPRPHPQLVVLGVQPQPDASAAAQGDVDAQLAQVTGGDVILLSMDSTTPAAAYRGSLDCPPELDEISCREMRIRKRAEISAAASTIIRRPEPASVDITSLLRVVQDEAELRSFETVNLYLDAAGPIVAGTVDASADPTLAPTALVDQVATTSAFVADCPAWRLNVVAAGLDPGASAAHESFVRELMSRCGGELAAWVGRWPSSDGAIPLPPSPNVRSVDDGTRAVITLDDRGTVTFVSGSADLTLQAQQTIDEIGRSLVANDAGRVIVRGYTDDIGPLDLNRDLARRRAETVATRLVAQGLPREDVDVESRGETDPIASNSDEAGRSLNRRVEIIVEHS